MNLNAVIESVNNRLWGWVLIILILGVGIILTVRTRIWARH